MKAVLVLEDGTVFDGESFGVKGEVVGEIVFNTGMTGYQEVLTDPSYHGQVVTMTYPLIGNYGVNIDDLESAKPQVKGFVVRELCDRPSNWRSVETLNEYFKRNNIIGIQGVDTRALTRHLRDKGTMRGIISTDVKFKFEDKKEEVEAYKIKNPVDLVTTREVKHYKGDGYKIALIDLGIKQNIIRSLSKRGFDIYVFPAYAEAKEILDIKPDAVMLSNGPGNPKHCVDTINTVKQLINDLPFFGICLGHQVIALANNADTQKLKFGHRGCNHPVKDIQKDLTYITSQNHGYTIIEESLDKSKMEVSHINMNDNTIEGIRYKDIPVFTVQFHPEASPGPTDTAYLFDEFLEMIKKCKDKSESA
ncbi:carbamoyl phosphate synthase small subunit [Herbivorax sp. ANBcel31]|uniref:carbamoyl phosphate synthase small subunit n=1 Tax=Herbivorax sp. ANBcel31 TaxID=3069754 RepID=UPI0027B143B3|nr:carbamoyl phosphate synthase small subunit [Herbivorax sp. ANBcel31]MDQ2085241.1 carbamoyl phosphate synthase small subunit [Herbivorax sp. ANBcel31]